MTIDNRGLVEFVAMQRWFAAKTQDVVQARVVDRAELADGDGSLELMLVEMRFETGTHETYQLLARDGSDVLQREGDAIELLRAILRGERISGGEGMFELATVSSGIAGLGMASSARLISAEQSNSSVVYDDELILKVFRRLEPGVNPELEMLRFLSERRFPHVPALAGWYAYTGEPMDATLGILQRFVASGRDGWELALDTIAGDPDWFHGRLRRLGEILGDLHTMLGSEATDPAFAPEATSTESLGLLTATVDEEIEALFANLPEDDVLLEPVRGRGEEVRERLRLLTNIGGVGRVIRCHGDFHLGQTLSVGDDWLLIDFEGEPARPISERRRKRSPLRDVAGLLRSLAYAYSAAPLLRDVRPPSDWETRARAAFLDGYRSSVDGSLVPFGSSLDKLLQVFELEKAVYELRYELNNRPAWVEIPVAGIVRLLDEEVPV